MGNNITIKRIYEDAKDTDGFRVLVDRLWPRGVSKKDAKLNIWLKQIAPSDELRKWFDHKPERFDKFKERYTKELKSNPATKQIEQIIQQNNKTTLLYGAHNKEQNQAVVLKDYLAQIK